MSVVGKEFEESSAVIIVWSPPTLHHGQDPKLFSYIVEYCELNKLATCMNKTLGSSTSVEISGLKRSNFYQYKVFVFDETNVSGATRDGIYVTANRGRKILVCMIILARRPIDVLYLRSFNLKCFRHM